MRVCLFSFLIFLLAACVTNNPSVEEVGSEREIPEPAGTAIAKPVLGVETDLPTPTAVSDTDGMIMLYVYPGQFHMGIRSYPAGSGIELFLDEIPRHSVYLDGYWIDKTEVSNRMYALCQNAGACTQLNDEEYSVLLYGDFIAADFPDYPVVGVSWFHAREYCEWEGRRLPTEAEWEKAAGGISGQMYPWGHSEPTGQHVNLCTAECLEMPGILPARDPGFVDSYRTTAPVVSFSIGASPYGALNLAGNVWEWVADWYAEDYYANSPTENPAGPASGAKRVIRGGGWLSDLMTIRTSQRRPMPPADSNLDLGFRCAVSSFP